MITVRDSITIDSGGPYSKPGIEFQLRFRQPGNSRSHRLREGFQLLKIAGHGSDFERARRIMNWVRSRWDHGWDHRNERSALQILRAAAKGRRFCCAHYSRTFVECCLAIGLPARELCVLRKGADFTKPDENNIGHSVSEVFCIDLQKWVMFDTDSNAFYTQHDIPLSALEIHRSWHSQRGHDITKIFDDPLFVTPRSCSFCSDVALQKIWKKFNRHQTKDYYFRIVAMLPESVNKPLKNEAMHFVWFVGIVPPPLAFLGAPLNRNHDTIVTCDGQFNWPLQQTFITATILQEQHGSIILHPDHSLPFFDHYEISVGGRNFKRITSENPVISVPQGNLNINVRAVDYFGRPGCVANLRLNRAAPIGSKSKQSQKGRA